MRKNDNIVLLMQQKYDQVRKASDVISTMVNDWQVIQDYLRNRTSLDKLTDLQQEKLKRYNFIYSNLLGGKYGKKEVIDMAVKFFGIGITQAYEDFNCTQEIYSIVVQVNKLFELQMELESAKQLKRKAEISMDFKAAASFQKNIIELQKLIPEKEEKPGEFFEGHTIEAVFDPRKLGAPDVNMVEIMTAINAKRGTEFKTDMFEEIKVENGN